MHIVKFVFIFHLCQSFSFMTAVREKLKSLKSFERHLLSPFNCEKTCLSEIKRGIEYVIACAIVRRCHSSFVSNFYLYTKDSKTTPKAIDPDKPQLKVPKSFKPEKKVAILVHGLLSNHKVHWINHTRDALIEYHNFNVIVFQWRSSFDKPLTASQLGMVLMADMFAEDIEKMVSYLIKKGWKSSKIYMVGHSMGSHMIGIAAQGLKKKGSVLLKRVTGLDPAGFIFDAVQSFFRIDKSVAEFVDCIFTAAPIVSLKHPVCTANFYPNYYGEIQPGIKSSSFAKAITLSHKRAPHLYAESLLPGHEFRAQECTGLPHLNNSTCKYNKRRPALMGYPASPKLKGIFYVRTNGKYPFALNVNETKEQHEKAMKIMKEFS